jgi:hypothetical protein
MGPMAPWSQSCDFVPYSPTTKVSGGIQALEIIELEVYL